MTKILTTQNAQITTAAVEVKTLTISGKQVTLSVFRQLLRERLVSEEGAFNGIPWGHVNYHAWKCDDGTPHLHVVWQKGSELRTDFVRPPNVHDPIHLDDELGEEWLEAAVLDGWKPNGDRRSLIEARFPSGLIEIDVSEDVERVLWPFYGQGREEAVARLKSDERRSRQQLSVLVDLAIHARVLALLAFQNRWEELSVLPHLFIAV